MSEHTPEKSVKPPRRGGGLVALLLLVLLGGLAAGGWFGWQQWQAVTRHMDQQARQLQQLESRLAQRKQTHEQRLEQVGERLDDMAAELAARRDLLREIRSGGRTDWLLNEARALASLAEQRLQLTGDVSAARAMLAAADKVLARIDDPDVVAVRKALIGDLEVLRGAERVDVSGQVIRLGALREQVETLAVPAASRATGGEELDAGEGVWADLLAQLPLSVRRHQDRVPLPLTEQEASLVRLYLYTDIQKAQLALMQARPRVYRQALRDARDTLSAWFASEDPAVAQLDSALESLYGLPVEQGLPEIGEGLKAIRGLIAQREEEA